MTGARVVLGTRGSDLARAQARMVADALRAEHADLDIETKIIRTSGDENAYATDLRQGRKGMFTREIERALIAAEIDVAVHSAKDLPSEMDQALVIGAVLPRAAVGDLLISKSAELNGAATVGTSSVRRQHQLRAKWPEVQVLELRGNVPTRLRKLAESAELNAIVLARAGLDRLEVKTDFYTRELPLDEFVPAGGQGIIAMQIRRADERTRSLVAAVDDVATHESLRAEREFLRRLQGDCQSPVGVFAERNAAGEITIRAQVFDALGSAPRTAKLVRYTSEQPPEVIGAMLFAFIDGQRK